MASTQRQLTYREIADDLQGHILDGNYQPGDFIPAYRELAEGYRVSVSTAQRAVMLLRDRDLVRGAPGRGVYVLRKPGEPEGDVCR